MPSLKASALIDITFPDLTLFALTRVSSAKNGIIRVEADELIQGDGILVKGGGRVSNASLLNVQSKSQNVLNAIFRVDAPSMLSGKAVTIQANSLMDGNALVLENNGNGSDRSLVKLQSNATDQVMELCR